MASMIHGGDAKLELEEDAQRSRQRGMAKNTGADESEAPSAVPSAREGLFKAYLGFSGGAAPHGEGMAGMAATAIAAVLSSRAWWQRVQPITTRVQSTTCKTLLLLILQHGNRAMSVRELP